ncbi:hypothetical protein TNIN_201131 [Trichonephila inaurata madagascariensis]|uniref:Uncharacterized protein n=1 Tax=Trichonephila inaurata madagascariensis TaxID=2747483 RepID=A0A8X7CN75_9ARAC|nr:hypothetical protein TNIN_201131 [Trichonephila inaurata madagascariensis]
MVCGSPRHPANLRKAIRNLSVVKSDTSSIRSARIVEHVKSTMYDLVAELVLQTYTGAAKSIAVVTNGLHGLSLLAGKGASICLSHFARAILQGKQLRSVFMAWWPRKIQKLERSLEGTILPFK